jgi:hypothetical protein
MLRGATTGMNLYSSHHGGLFLEVIEFAAPDTDGFIAMTVVPFKGFRIVGKDMGDNPIPSAVPPERVIKKADEAAQQ